MKNLRKYAEGTLEKEEADRLGGALIRQELDRQYRQKWGAKLEKEYGVFRQKAADKRRVLSFWKKGLAIAATVALLATAIWLLFPAGPISYQQLATSYIENLPIMADQGVFRKGTVEETELRLQANAAFAAKNYEEAIRFWTAIEDQGSLTDYDRFYLGTSYLLDDPAMASRAVDYLSNLSEIPAELEQERDWVLALAYIRTDQLVEGKSLLQKIVQNQQYMATDAEELLPLLPAN